MNQSAYKIIFTGPVGAGKTTSIDAISDIPTVTTEQNATDDLKDKDHTTVAMDYGMMRLDNGEVIHLYGTPGQTRFNFMWEILTEGSIGMVILVNNNRDDPLKELRVFLDSHREIIYQECAVIGVTHMDEKSVPALDDYYRMLLEYDLIPAIFEVDANDPMDVRYLVSALLFSLDSELVE